MCFLTFVGIPQILHICFLTLADEFIVEGLGAGLVVKGQGHPEYHACDHGLLDKERLWM